MSPRSKKEYIEAIRLLYKKADRHEKTIIALLTISLATIDRILKPTLIQYKKRGRATTKPGTLLRKQIPIKPDQSQWGSILLLTHLYLFP